MKPKVKARLLVATSAVSALYFMCFAGLAYGGGYLWVRSGQFRPFNHLAVMDTLVWQPRVGTFYGFRTVSGDDDYQKDFIGAFYSPLILLQQRLLYPSIRTVESDGSSPKVRRSFPSRHQLHPSAQRELPEAEQTFEITWEQIAAKFLSGK